MAVAVCAVYDFVPRQVKGLGLERRGWAAGICGGAGSTTAHPGDRPSKECREVDAQPPFQDPLKRNAGGGEMVVRLGRVPTQELRHIGNREYCSASAPLASRRAEAGSTAAVLGRQRFQQHGGQLALAGRELGSLGHGKVVVNVRAPRPSRRDFLTAARASVRPPHRELGTRARAHLRPRNRALCPVSSSMLGNDVDGLQRAVSARALGRSGVVSTRRASISSTSSEVDASPVGSNSAGLTTSAPTPPSLEPALGLLRSLRRLPPDAAAGEPSRSRCPLSRRRAGDRGGGARLLWSRLVVFTSASCATLTACRCSGTSLDGVCPPPSSWPFNPRPCMRNTCRQYCCTAWPTPTSAGHHTEGARWGITREHCSRAAASGSEAAAAASSTPCPPPEDSSHPDASEKLEACG